MEKRNTVQREIVLNAVRELGCHATADEIYSAVSATYPSVSRGTVYRNLNVLSEDGRMRKIEVPGGAIHYNHICCKHCHVQCQECGRIFDVEMSVCPDIKEKIKESSGVKILDCDIWFRGICSDCENKENNQ